MASRVYERLSRASEVSRPELGAGVESMLAVALLVRTSRALTTNLDALLRPIGSSFARHQVLNIVDRAGPTGIPLGQIARQLFLHPATVTASVDRLEKEKCLRRTSDQSDRRTTLIVLTKAGKDQWTRGHKLLVQADFGIKGVPDNKLRQFTRLVDEVMAAVLLDRDQADLGPTNGAKRRKQRTSS